MSINELSDVASAGTNGAQSAKQARDLVVERALRDWRGDLEGLIGSAMIGHHLIMFAREASGGQQNASNYSIRLREASVPAE